MIENSVNLAEVKCNLTNVVPKTLLLVVKLLDNE